MEDSVKDVIRNKISEKNWLDYKVKEYEISPKSRSSLFKEVIGMLNSEESYGRDKFIIMGIEDESLYQVGIENPRDDNEYQDEFDNIKPRPKIEKGEIRIDDKTISYLAIFNDNNERPYVMKNDVSLEKYSLSQGASFIRRGTANYPLKEEKRYNIKFKTMKYKPGKTKIIQQINAAIRLKEFDYQDENLAGERTINPSQNNGKFNIGYNEFNFPIKFQSASNSTGRIYSDYGNIKVGKISNRVNLIETFNQSTDQIDFSSRVVDIYSDEVGVAVNEYGKIVFIEFLYVESQGHGKPEDKITFNWQIVDYEID